MVGPFLSSEKQEHGDRMLAPCFGLSHVLYLSSLEGTLISVSQPNCVDRFCLFMERSVDETYQ